ncbi:signal peptidase I [Kocuria flava]|uniref:signal peptidase I n=1 Tax=Kocuria flava TaxID=446860 RepID=UPI002F950731
MTARRAVRRTATAGLLAACSVVALRLWVLEPLVVGSDSMEPTLREGALVLLLKTGDPDRAVPGALVVFESPADGRTTVKRAVAREGQTVALEDSVLVVDGRPAAEPFVDRRSTDGEWFGPVTVPPRHVFVLGDNRALSLDSRDYGSVPVSAVEAVVLHRGTTG